MNGSWRKYIAHIPATLLVVGALAGLACGAAATPTPAGKATPSAKATPVPLADKAAPTAVTAPRPTLTPIAAPKREEVTLRVGIHRLSQPPDPVKGRVDGILQGLAETLFKPSSKDLKPEPWLATGARQLDEKTWEVSLRLGVKFHNGALMDAAAVKASLERAIAKSPTAKAVLDIARIEVNNPSTLTITTNNPNPIFPASLTEPNSAIANAAAAEAMGDAFTDQAVLTGPFKVERYQRDKEMVAVRHDEYWGPRPLVDRVIFIYLPDDNSRVLALQSGDIDIAFYIGPQSVTTIKSASNLAVVPAGRITLNLMFLNHRREPWKDVRVRQAIALAINREGLVKGAMQGEGVPAIGPFPPIMLSCPQLRGHPFDPAKAKQLLAQAGYRDQDGDGYLEKEGQILAMTLLTYRQVPELVPMAEIIQANLKAIGIKVNVRLVEQITAAMQQGDWDGGMFSRNVADGADPYGALSQFFLTGASTANRGGFSDPEVDELIRQLAVTRDPRTRDQLACDATQAVVDKVAQVPLALATWNYGVSRGVTGFDEPHPSWFYFIDSKIGKR